MTDLNEKPVLVCGASGFVGSHITRRLVEQGRRVRVLLRKTSNTDALRDLPVEILHGDVLDPASLRTAMQGCGTVFYSVVDPRFWLTDTTPIYRNNVEGVVNAMDVALECGIRRFIFTSTMGTLGLNPDGPVTEDIPFNWRDRASAYILARLEAETRFLACCRDKGLPGVALCVANTYGPGDHQPTPHGQLLRDVARGKVKYVLDAGAPTVDIRDVADAALLAEQHGHVGERYIIASEFISNREFYALAAAQGGYPPPKTIPLRLAWSLAWASERVLKLLRRKDFVVTTDAVFLTNVFQRMDSSKARRQLGWNPRPVTETIRDAAAWYAQSATPAVKPVDLSVVAEELRGPVRKMPRMPFASASGRSLMQALIGLIPTATYPGVRIERRKDLSPRLRIYHPAVRKSDAALYWMHGGGFLIGRPVLGDPLCAMVARELGIVVVSVQYRLAPQHPFPIPLDDCYAGWQWLQQSATQLGVDPARIAVGGQSAGGALAATLVQRIHDAGGRKAAAQWLFCPMLDDRTAARRELDGLRHFLWTNRDNAFGWRSYLAAEPGARELPRHAVAARREDLTGLPPAWIGVGTIDLFHAEDREYAERLRAAGVATEFLSVEGAPHGFEAWAPDTKVAQAFLAQARAWLEKTLSGAA